MAFSIRMNEQEERIAKAYAAMYNISLGEAFKQALFEKIEDEFDLKIAEEAYAEYIKKPVKYSLKDIMEEEGL